MLSRESSRTAPQVIRERDLTMEVRFEEDRDLLVGLQGSLDLDTVSAFDAQLRRAETERPRSIVVGLADLEFIDTTGISKLIAALNRARRGGWSFRLQEPLGQVARALEICGLSDAFELIA